MDINPGGLLSLPAKQILREANSASVYEGKSFTDRSVRNFKAPGFPFPREDRFMVQLDLPGER